MALDFNIEPFFDDYSEDDKFYRILFRPGYAVQARELTQMQTILQQQIKRHGDHIFKNGSMVIPGQISYDNNTQYVKLKTLTSASASVSTASVISAVVGKTYRGATSGVEAIVLMATPLEVVAGVTEADTIFVKYTKGNGRFSYSEIISPTDGSSGLDLIVQDYAIDALTLGVGSTASIERGIYYIKDNFVLVTAQNIVLSKFSSTPSAKAGLQVIEEVKYPEDDGYDILLDNALGSPNYAAPGAARYYIDLVLKVVAYDLVTDPYEFVTLLTLVNGAIQFLVDKTEYAQIEKTLARRTYDESGNYTVRHFPVNVKEYRNNYRDAWAINNTYILGDIVTANSTTYKCILNHNSPSTGTFAIGSNWIEDTTPRYNYGIYKGITYSNNIATDITPTLTKISVAIEPGKAYVQGYEVEKVATQYLTLDKSRSISTLETLPVHTSPGNYILVNSLYGTPEISRAITFYDRMGVAGAAPSGGIQVATARVRQIQLHSTGIYKLFLFDIVMSGTYNFARDAKYAYCAGSGSYIAFTAQIEPTLIQVAGSLVTAASSTTINGVNSTFLLDFKVGDYISISGTTSRISVITSNNSITIDVAVAVLATSTNINRIETSISLPDSLASIYVIPQYAIQSTQNVRYTFYKKRLSQASGVAFTEAGYSFGPTTDTTNYIVVNRSNGSYMTQIQSGTPSSSQFTAVISGSQITFTMGVGSTGPYDIIYAVVQLANGSAARPKTLTNITESALTLSSGSAILARSDGYELIKVTNAGIDVTSKFKFDSGQTATYYGLASVSTTETITGTINVTYSYFAHGTGDYVAVNSYTANTSNITYEELPTYATNTLDFRQRKNNDGTWDGCVVPKYGEDSSIEYYYYLGRIDKLSVDTTGEFIITAGIPDAKPVEPKSPDNAMDLYIIHVEPYTFTAQYGVICKKTKSQRYTMHDIGKLENRIENLEYYTSLSLLEQNTVNIKAYDKYGVERPQNGFLVDSFNGQGVGDVVSTDWKASIDYTNRELRPFYTFGQVPLFENIGTILDRTSKNYEVNGDLVTLKIASTTPLVKQLRASHTESVNPFNVYSFAGIVNINPWSDTWFETQRRPDVIINDNGQYDALVYKANVNGILGTFYGAITTIWSGDHYTGTTYKYETRGWLDSVTTTLNYSGNTGTTSQNIKTVAISTPTYTTTTVSDKVVSTEVIPYMRSRNILFRGAGFKPETPMYTFFDGMNVNSSVTPSKRIEVVGYGSTTVPTFLLNSNVGSNVNSTARKVNGLVETSFTYGEVLSEYVSVSGGAATLTGVTCVLLGQETKNANYLLYIDNILGGSLHADSGNNVYYLKGEFTTGNVKYVSTSLLNQLSPTQLTTTYSGQLFGIFNIPNSATLSFRTGVRQLRFTDSSTNTIGSELTYSEQSYEARGTLDWTEKTILSTKTAEISTTNITATGTVKATPHSTSSTVITDNTPPPPVWEWQGNGGGGGGEGVDPLAQTFMVDLPGGVFVTDIDLFFSAKDENIPVKIELRNVVNGYPGGTVIPYSRVVKYPSTINVDSSKGQVATKFKFESPIYLQDSTEYCVCIFADSAKYKLWVSQSGEIDVNGSGLIQGQPSLGVLFKSQNASTWTADQLQDLKFQLNRAVFTTSTATLDLVNQHVTTNSYYDTLNVDVNNLIVSNTSITAQYLDTVTSAYRTIELGKITAFDSPRLLKSSANEAGTPSLKVTLVLATTATNLSPVIDLSRCTATTTNNVIEGSNSDNEVSSLLGTATAKYVTKQVNLNDNATTLRILFNANVPNLADTDVDVYYKVGNSGSPGFDAQLFVLASPKIAYQKMQNPKQFTEAQYLIEDMAPFNCVKVKLVLKSLNTSQVPRIKDLRVIAYA